MMIIDKPTIFKEMKKSKLPVFSEQDTMIIYQPIYLHPLSCWLTLLWRVLSMY